MKIPLLDVKAQIKPIRKEIDRAIKQVIDSGSFILGEEVKILEEKITDYCNVGYAIGASNGTDAISLALQAVGVKPRDGVICPAFTYYATAGAIARIGARPIFADIDSRTYNISTESIISEIKSQRSEVRIKAIIPVHLYGQCADMDEIMKIAKRYNLKVIEDTAQGFGASYKGKKAGTIGDCGTISFYPGKNLGALGDAGCMVTNNKGLAEKLYALRNQGTAPKDRYRHIYIGCNARPDTIQAAVLAIKLKYLDKGNKKRRENAKYYNDRLKGLHLNTPYVPAYNVHIYHQYVLRIEKVKERVRQNLVKKGIDSRTFYPIPLHLQPCFKYLGYKKGNFPESEKCASELLAIPVYPELTKKQMDYVIKAIKEAMCESL